MLKNLRSLSSNVFNWHFHLFFSRQKMRECKMEKPSKLNFWFAHFRIQWLVSTPLGGEPRPWGRCGGYVRLLPLGPHRAAGKLGRCLILQTRPVPILARGWEERREGMVGEERVGGRGWKGGWMEGWQSMEQLQICKARLYPLSISLNLSFPPVSLSLSSAKT